MLQLFIITELYLSVGAVILLADRYGVRYVLMLNIREFCLQSKKTVLFFFVSGLVICFGLLFFPIAPGPEFIGDFFPALSVFILSFMFLRPALKSSSDYFSNNKEHWLGWYLIVIAVLHFLFPSLVLI